jgi:hypothetical protein
MSPGLDRPCRSIDDYRIALRAERYTTMLAQMEAETAGSDRVAAHYARRIAEIDARLREIEGAEKS